MTLTLFIVAAALFLAFSNGANDNFKGFATVWGSGMLSYRQALMLATVATAAGSLLSLLLANGLVAQFSGKGLIADATVARPDFVAAVAAGAAATVMMATRVGMPISTTHALIGSLVGAGLAMSGEGIRLAALGSGFLAPLLISPLLAASLAAVVVGSTRRRRRRADCLCVEAAPLAASVAGSGAVPQPLAMPRIRIASDATCDQMVSPVARLSLAGLLGPLHILSAASICFARGLNDTPKLVALLIGAKLMGFTWSVLWVALAMGTGGLLLARRVAETMSNRINHMDDRQGASANFITAILVLFASKFGLPVSTTHVSVGSIAGAGLGSGTLDRAALLSVLLSWVATLPAAIFLSWAIAMVLR